MKIKNKTAGHAGIACFSFALKGNRAGSPHFKIVRFKWWEHVTVCRYHGICLNFQLTCSKECDNIKKQVSKTVETVKISRKTGAKKRKNFFAPYFLKFLWAI